MSASSQDTDEMAALHWASAQGMHEIMDALIARNAPLEARNTWGGTVVDCVAWFAANDPQTGVDYPRVVARLLEAGADPDEIYPPLTGNPEVDAVIVRYRESFEKT